MHKNMSGLVLTCQSLEGRLFACSLLHKAPLAPPHWADLCLGRGQKAESGYGWEFQVDRGSGLRQGVL